MLTRSLPPAHIIGEILVYDRALSPTELTQLETALEARYGIP